MSEAKALVPSQSSLCWAIAAGAHRGQLAFGRGKQRRAAGCMDVQALPCERSTRVGCCFSRSRVGVAFESLHRCHGAVWFRNGAWLLEGRAPQI